MKPLAGVVVVDLTHALAGPVCAGQLALLGAEVIKIEPPGAGDDFRDFSPATFVAVNAGKQSVTLNLKNPASLAVLERLVRRADVMVDNFKPGTAERWGITWERVRGWNDQLIWCSISGFGLEGPWRDKPAVEWSVQGASGMTDAYVADDADPRETGLGVLDVSTGHTAATSILAALLLRAKTGKGQRIDVAMIDVALNLGPTRIVAAAAKRELRPAVGRFMAKDRRVFVMGAHQRWFETIARVLGAPLLTDDPLFATPAARLENAEALLPAIEARLAARTAEDWETALTDAGVPAAVVRQAAEVVESEHIRQRGLVHDVAVGDGGAATRVLGPAYKIAGVPLPPPSGVPALGAQTDAVLGGVGYSPGEIQDLRRDGVV